VRNVARRAEPFTVGDAFDRRSQAAGVVSALALQEASKKRKAAAGGAHVLCLSDLETELTVSTLEQVPVAT
jgi:hypothetical protein